MGKLILHYVLIFFLNELVAWESNVDWNGLEAKLDDHINRFFPVKIMDKGLIALAHFVFQSIKIALSEEATLAALINDVAIGNWQGALNQLENLLVGAVPQLKGVI